MKAQFNKASKNDGTLVTVNLTQFEEEFGLNRQWIGEDGVLYITIDGQEVQFRVNRIRDGKAVTATTHCFPRYLRLPRVGHPVFAEVTEVY